jgi:hypothetical protein
MIRPFLEMPDVRERAGKVERTMFAWITVGYALSADGWPPLRPTAPFRYATRFSHRRRRGFRAR